MKKNKCECIKNPKTPDDISVFPSNTLNLKKENFDENNFKFIYELTIKYISTVLFQQILFGCIFQWKESRASYFFQ